MTTSVLLVDDDPVVRDLLRRFFRERGMHVSVLHDGSGLMHRLELERPSVVVLDIMMPNTDDKIAGLECGADDYLAKPFDPRELLARIETVLRRRASAPSRPERVPREKIGRFEVDFVTRSLVRGEERIALRDSEFALLKIFVRHPYKILSRVLIHDLLRGDDLAFRDRGLDVPIWRLRRIIEEDPSNPRHVQTVRGQGYVFVPDTDGAAFETSVA
jgi:two-component system, OmpR family, phosphate regulon response regulator OmpR